MLELVKLLFTLLPLFFFQINREMMALIESLQRKAVEDGDRGGFRW
jgi:hypothetical protein